MNPETRIEQAFYRWCCERGIPCLKVKAEGVRGFPDRMVLLNKRIVFIEFKTPNGILSEHQKRCHDALRYLNLEIHVCRTKDEAIHALGPEIAPLPKSRNKPSDKTNGRGKDGKRVVP
jgi:hypothetical protein